MNGPAPQLRNVHWTLWAIPVAMSMMALAEWPYGYYSLLRVVICTTAGWIAWVHYNLDGRASRWVLAFAFLALLFNPFLKVHLSRDVWMAVNVATALTYGVNYWTLFRRSTRHR